MLETVFAGSSLIDGKYQLLHRLGSGGMGRVYKARHVGLKRAVSVKLLHPRHQLGEGALRRLEREAEALGRLDHPNVVTVSDFGVESRRHLPYLVMELLEGVALSEHLKTAGPLPLTQALPLLRQIAEALDAAHSAGVLHRDLKPANVFLVDDGAGGARAKVLDFGLARMFFDDDATPQLTPDGTTWIEPLVQRAGIELTPEGDFIGTPGYVAPEQLERAETTPASDLYAFGVLCYRMLTGRLPFEGSGIELVESQLLDDPLPPSARREGLGAEVDRAVLALLAHRPAARPATARAAIAELETAAAAEARRGWLRRELPRRLSCAAVIGAGAALLAFVLTPFCQPLEGPVVDARFYLGPRQPPSHPITLVLIDDASLTADPTPLSQRADELAGRVAAVLDAGAAGVGVDLLLPPTWKRSEALSRLVLRHADRLVLAAFSPPEGRVLGPEALEGLITAALGPVRVERLFGFVNLDQDGDGAVRRARTRFLDLDGHRRPSFAAAAQSSLQSTSGDRPEEGSFWIDFTLDWQRFDQVSWHQLPAVLERSPKRFTGRFVLVGAVYAGASDGSYRAPHPRGLPQEVPGPVLQALTLHTLLDDRPVRSSGVATLALLSLLAAGMASAALLAERAIVFRATAGTTLTVWIAAGWVAFLTARVLVPLVAGTLALLAALVFAAQLRRRWTHFPQLPGENE